MKRVIAEVWASMSPETWRDLISSLPEGIKVTANAKVQRESNILMQFFDIVLITAFFFLIKKEYLLYFYQ